MVEALKRRITVSGSVRYPLPVCNFVSLQCCITPVLYKDCKIPLHSLYQIITSIITNKVPLV